MPGQLPYDPMTPQIDDYQAAQGAAKLAGQHYAWVNKQTNDPKTIKEAGDAMKAANQRLNNAATARAKAKAAKAK